MRASNAAGPLGPKDLGRATAKFEGLSDMLEACQAEWAALPSSGAPLSEALFSYAAPCPVLPVEPSRLTFVGKPSFDPEPYLDSQNRATYARPLDFAREVPGEEPIPESLSGRTAGRRESCFACSMPQAGCACSGKTRLGLGCAMVSSPSARTTHVIEWSLMLGLPTLRR